MTAPTWSGDTQQWVDAMHECGTCGRRYASAAAAERCRDYDAD